MDFVKQELQKVERYLKSDNRMEIPLSSIEQQLKCFINGIKYPKLIKACSVDDGIIKLSQRESDDLIKNFNSAALNGHILKFVPASGAATRMFHKIQSVINRYNNFNLNNLREESVKDDECKYVYEFLTKLSKFAFYDDLKNTLNTDETGIVRLVQESPFEVLKAVLFKNGLNYSEKPKGAIKFHRYEVECRTAFEEQIYESLQYSADRYNLVKIHFTISEEHTDLFNQIITNLKQKLSNTDFKINVSYSYQKKHTDTIAVNMNNEILFDDSGKLILRPGGHGALLENLNELNGDIIVIKNIDNLCVEKYSADTILYKKLLIGVLIKIQSAIFEYLKLLENKNLDDNAYDEIMLFAEKNLSIQRPKDFIIWNKEAKNKFLFAKLNRPIRVCGMVKNEGEPGGGPFWVQSDNGDVTLQIVEQAQINFEDENQKRIYEQSTHFNPVDLVCGVKDYKGNKFDLMQFSDPDSGIIAKKSKDGLELKALELPGLWNGAMAYWNTIFVEVPITTFNPVKEINDLLKKAHQNL